MIKITVREDAETCKTVIIHDDGDNYVGELIIDETPTGVRVNGYDANDERHAIGTLVLRR